MKVLHIKQFFQSKWIWFRMPPRCDVVVFDQVGYEKLKHYLVGYNVFILSVRGEEFYLWCLVKSLFMRRFWRGGIMLAYSVSCLKSSSPKVVITFIDNTKIFYQLSHLLKNRLKTVLVQNGWRDQFLRQYCPTGYEYVDYMCLYNDLIATYYSKYIGGQCYTIGSLPNNLIVGSGISLPDSPVIFISQFRDFPKGYIDLYDTRIPFSDFYLPERMLLPLLSQWCLRNSKKLIIVGVYSIDRIFSSSDTEYSFFDELLDCDWDFYEKKDEGSSYKILGAAGTVVTVDSNLGYEAFVRGKKTAFLTCRGQKMEVDDRGFAWHANNKDNGPFWTNHVDEKEFIRVLDYVNTVSDKDWEVTRKQYADDIMVYDPGNSRFKTLLEKLLPRSATIE
jgi:surface carbohydrate biosynthesis protein